MVGGKRSEQYGNLDNDSPDKGKGSHPSWGQKRMGLLGGIWMGECVRF